MSSPSIDDGYKLTINMVRVHFSLKAICRNTAVRDMLQRKRFRPILDFHKLPASWRCSASIASFKHHDYTITITKRLKAIQLFIRAHPVKYLSSLSKFKTFLDSVLQEAVISLCRKSSRGDFITLKEVTFQIKYADLGQFHCSISPIRSEDSEHLVSCFYSMKLHLFLYCLNRYINQPEVEAILAESHNSIRIKTCASDLDSYASEKSPRVFLFLKQILERRTTLRPDRNGTMHSVSFSLNELKRAHFHLQGFVSMVSSNIKSLSQDFSLLGDTNSLLSLLAHD